MVKSFDIKKDVPNDTSYNLRIYKRLSDATILVCFQDDSNRNDKFFHCMTLFQGVFVPILTFFQDFTLKIGSSQDSVGIRG